MRLLVTSPRGAEALLAKECESFDLKTISTGVGIIAVEAPDYAACMRVCLESRIAGRVILVLAEWEGIESTEDLYEAVSELVWQEHLASSSTFAVRVTGQAPWMTNSQYVAMLVKDAVVDQMRKHGDRSSVDRASPDLLIQVRVLGGHVILGLDLSGRSLHERGYRQETGQAPLKEHLAAALLMHTGWPDAGTDLLIDPCCGSGTLLIEACMLWYGLPPRQRIRYGFHGWLQHDVQVFEDLSAAFADRPKRQEPCRLFGFDQAAVESARRNTGDLPIIFEQARFQDLPVQEPGALVVMNPPYGTRLDADQTLYRDIGHMLKKKFPTSRAHVLAPFGPLCHEVGLRAHERAIFWNGPLELRFLAFRIT